MKKDVKKIIGITTVASSIALEIAALISALPMKKYKEKYQKFLNETEDNKNKYTKIRNRAIVLGTTAVALAVAGIKLNHKKKDEDNFLSDIYDEKSEGKIEVIEETVEEPVNGTVEETIKEQVEENDEKPVKVQKEEFGKKWKCIECNHENDAEKKVCSYCGTLRQDILSQALKEW